MGFVRHWADPFHHHAIQLGLCGISVGGIQGHDAVCHSEVTLLATGNTIEQRIVRPEGFPVSAKTKRGLRGPCPP